MEENQLIRYTVAELIAEIRRQAAMRNATWPCVLLRDLLPLCDAFERLRDAAARVDALTRSEIVKPCEFSEAWKEVRELLKTTE